MDKKLKILGVSGSMRKISYTKFALDIALKTCEEMGAEVEHIHLREYKMMFCEEFDDYEDFPDVLKFKQKMKEADCIILGTPEYHGDYSGVLKNALDLIGRKEVENKLIGLVGVAGGSLGAAQSLQGLRKVMRHLRAWIVPAFVSIPQASKKFTKEGELLDDTIGERLHELSTTLMKMGKHFVVEYN